MGGSIAYEMALQLQEHGEDVPFLALFDSRVEVSFPVNLEHEPENARAVLAFTLATASYLGKEPSIDLESLERLEAAERWPWLLECLGANSVSPSLFGARELAASYHAWRKGLLRLSQYEPRPRYQHSIRLFRAQDPAPPEVAGLLNTGVLDSIEVDRWRRLSAEPLVLYEVPGNHFNMMQRPHVSTLASILRAVLDTVG
jgi:thioesterase domain-containing protein